MSTEVAALQPGPSMPTIECEKQFQFLSRNKPGVFVLYAFSDSGHGWVRIRKDVLGRLGIAGKITPYSYMRRQFAYLEEDADASLLVETLLRRGITVTYRDRTADGRSRIRMFESYRKP
ncbi:MAG: hypothetical protein JRN21_09550 [Nitrososphaerota archaeon]|nr:hypothetical protein [Nitrososphaerota archaeon]